MFFQTRSAKTLVFAETRQGFKSFYRKTKTLLLIVYNISKRETLLARDSERSITLRQAGYPG